MSYYAGETELHHFAKCECPKCGAFHTGKFTCYCKKCRCKDADACEKLGHACCSRFIYGSKAKIAMVGMV